MTEYAKFEEGFLKAAEAEGCDVPFLRGYIKEADEIVQAWAEVFDKLAAEHNDPQYKIKMANELIMLNMLRPQLIKAAVEQEGEGFMSGFGRLTGIDNMQANIANKMAPAPGTPPPTDPNHPGLRASLRAVLQKNPHLITSLISGGGAGGLIGLLLGSLMGNSGLGMALGGLGGAGLSAYFNNKDFHDNINGWFNPPEKKPDTATPPPKDKPAEAASTTPPAAPPTPTAATPPPPPPTPPPINDLHVNTPEELGANMNTLNKSI